MEAFEQEMVDQYALAMASAGLTDSYVDGTRRIVCEFARSLRGPLWTATCADADRFLAGQRREGRALSTRATKATTLAQFFEFVISRYQGDVSAVFGQVVSQPIDEFNKPPGFAEARVRVPPSKAEVDPALRLLARRSWRCPQVSAGGPGLLRCVAVAAPRPADQRDRDAGCP